MKPALALLAVLCAFSAYAAEKPRVFVTDSKSWEIAGASGGSSAGFGGATLGGARPQTAEIIKTFGERCPDLTVNNNQELADYVVLLDHEGGKGIVRRDNKVAIFNRSGDSIFSHSTRSLGNAVQDTCNAVLKDWSSHGSVPLPRKGSPATAAAASAGDPALDKVFIEVSANQNAADIEIDGNFVGTTPSKIGVAPGPHTITVRKAGFKAWERRMTVSAGNIRVEASLEPE